MTSIITKLPLKYTNLQLNVNNNSRIASENVQNESFILLISEDNSGAAHFL